MRHEIKITFDDKTGKIGLSAPKNIPMANFMLDKAKALVLDPPKGNIEIPKLAIVGQNGG